MFSTEASGFGIELNLDELKIDPHKVLTLVNSCNTLGEVFADWNAGHESEDVDLDVLEDFGAECEGEYGLNSVLCSILNERIDTSAFHAVRDYRGRDYIIFDPGDSFERNNEVLKQLSSSKIEKIFSLFMGWLSPIPPKYKFQEIIQCR